VQEGQDLRFVTNEVLAHFRNLLLVKTAPGQHDLLDVTDQEAERLAAQATKYSTPELGRVIALLIAAQTDMRWTTSPRLSLELALIRATIPETDAAPEALVSRLERLERVAGITGGGGSGAAAPGSDSPARSRPGTASTSQSAGSQSPSSATPAPPAPATRPTVADVPGGPAADGAGETADSAPLGVETKRTRSARGAEASGAAEVAPGSAEAGTDAGTVPVLGAGTSAVDVTMLRSNWPTVISHLRSSGKAVLPSFLEIATPASFDGTTLELVFPPERPYGVQKVIEREAELRQALQDLFGITPTITCVIRDPVAGPAEPVEDEPLSEDEALARLASELGATPASEDGS
jgi:DNA polymerase-3 subunit gamma/tau